MWADAWGTAACRRGAWQEASMHAAAIAAAGSTHRREEGLPARTPYRPPGKRSERSDGGKGKEQEERETSRAAKTREGRRCAKGTEENGMEEKESGPF